MVSNCLLLVIFPHMCLCLTIALIKSCCPALDSAPGTCQCQTTATDIWAQLLSAWLASGNRDVKITHVPLRVRVRVCVCAFMYVCMFVYVYFVKDFTHVLLQLANTNYCFWPHSHVHATRLFFSEIFKNSQLLVHYRLFFPFMLD